MSNTGRLLHFFAFFMPFAAWAGTDTIEDSSTKTIFPSRLERKEGETLYELKATGATSRSFFVVKVYSVAHYMANSPLELHENPFDGVLDSKGPKQLTMRWLRPLELSKIQDTYYETFDKAFTEDQKDAFRSDIEKFIASYDRDVRKGDEHVLYWTNAGDLQIWYDGKLMGEIHNPAFARLVWSLWFGPKSVVDRSKLVAAVGDEG